MRLVKYTAGSRSPGDRQRIQSRRNDPGSYLLSHRIGYADQVTPPNDEPSHFIFILELL
jgi:hypothetical protein